MSNGMMKAVRFHQFGGPEVLRFEDAPKPELKPGEVLVRVRAIGLNPPDWYLREGYSALPPEWRPAISFPAIPGTDVSGTVAAVADDVSAFAFGDDVFGMLNFPSYGESLAYAQFVAARASDLSLKPASVSHDHAAAVAMSGLTAWQFLIALGHDEPNPLQSGKHEPIPLRGKTVLVNGAAGGVGHIAAQLAIRAGGHVIGVASGKHGTFLRALGVEFIDYGKVVPENILSDLDLVLDCVGGPTSARFLKTLRTGGALFPVFPLGFDAHAEAAERGVTVSATQVRSSGSQLSQIALLMANGDLTVEIDSSFPLSDAKGAHERAEEGHLRGKIILRVGDDS